MAIIAVMFAGQTCWMANQLALLSEYFPRSAVATVISISAIGGSLGGIVATLLTGQAVQHYGYVPVFTVMSGLHLIALTAIGFVLFRRQGLGSYVTAGT